MGTKKAFCKFSNILYLSNRKLNFFSQEHSYSPVDLTSTVLTRYYLTENIKGKKFYKFMLKKMAEQINLDYTAASDPINSDEVWYLRKKIITDAYSIYQAKKFWSECWKLYYLLIVDRNHRPRNKAIYIPLITETVEAPGTAMADNFMYFESYVREFFVQKSSLIYNYENFKDQIVNMTQDVFSLANNALNALNLIDILRMDLNDIVLREAKNNVNHSMYGCLVPLLAEDLRKSVGGTEKEINFCNKYERNASLILPKECRRYCEASNVYTKDLRKIFKITKVGNYRLYLLSSVVLYLLQCVVTTEPSVVTTH